PAGRPRPRRARGGALLSVPTTRREHVEEHRPDALRDVQGLSEAIAPASSSARAHRPPAARAPTSLRRSRQPGSRRGPRPAERGPIRSGLAAPAPGRAPAAIAGRAPAVERVDGAVLGPASAGATPQAGPARNSTLLRYRLARMTRAKSDIGAAHVTAVRRAHR